MWLAVTKFKNNPLDVVWGRPGSAWLETFPRQFPKLPARSFLFMESQPENIQFLAEKHRERGKPPGVTEELEPAYESLIKDGGLSHLKHVISSRLLSDVRRAVEATITGHLDRVRESIEKFREEQK